MTFHFLLGLGSFHSLVEVLLLCHKTFQWFAVLTTSLRHISAESVASHTCYARWCDACLDFCLTGCLITNSSQVLTRGLSEGSFSVFHTHRLASSPPINSLNALFQFSRLLAFPPTLSLSLSPFHLLLRNITFPSNHKKQ